MIEFVVLFPGGHEVLITCPPDELSTALSEQYYGLEIDMTYRNATDEEAECSAVRPMSHTDSWWEGYACKACGEP